MDIALDQANRSNGHKPMAVVVLDASRNTRAQRAKMPRRIAGIEGAVPVFAKV